jgi:hypothetical protein
MKKLIREVAEAFPGFVGGKLFSRVLMTPEFKQNLKQFNEFAILEV